MAEIASSPKLRQVKTCVVSWIRTQWIDAHMFAFVCNSSPLLNDVAKQYQFLTGDTLVRLRCMGCPFAINHMLQGWNETWSPNQRMQWIQLVGDPACVDPLPIHRSTDPRVMSMFFSMWVLCPPHTLLGSRLVHKLERFHSHGPLIRTMAWSTSPSPLSSTLATATTTGKHHTSAAAAACAQQEITEDDIDRDVWEHTHKEPTVPRSNPPLFTTGNVFCEEEGPRDPRFPSNTHFSSLWQDPLPTSLEDLDAHPFAVLLWARLALSSEPTSLCLLREEIERAQQQHRSTYIPLSLLVQNPGILKEP